MAGKTIHPSRIPFFKHDFIKNALAEDGCTIAPLSRSSKTHLIGRGTSSLPTKAIGGGGLSSSSLLIRSESRSSSEGSQQSARGTVKWKGFEIPYGAI